MSVKSFRKWVLIFLGMLALFLIIRELGGLVPKRTHFSKLEQIAHELRIRVQPTRLTLGNETVFKLELESYERPDILEIDVLENTLLVDQDETPYLPLTWQEDTRHEYGISGTLQFPPLPPETTEMKLYFYEMEDHEFGWKIQSGEGKYTGESEDEIEE